MTDETKKAAGTTTTSRTADFVLDDRSIGTQLDAFRQYSQRLPYAECKVVGWPESTNWAQVVLGFEAGAWAAASTGSAVWHEAAALAWAFERDRLVKLYETPEQADGQLPPERAFLLSLLGMLETPRALLNQLPAQHRSLYYRQMLALEAQAPQADGVTVHFTLVDGVREQVLPAGLLLDAGQDGAGNALRYALTQPLTVNAARVTDLRWVVNDPYMPGGRRARIVLDEAGGQTWPVTGVRMFGRAPLNAGEPPRADADRVVDSGRIIESPVLDVAGGERTWTVTLASALSGGLTAAVSMGEAWVPLVCTQNTKPNTTWTITLPANGGAPSAVSALDGLTSTAPLLRLTSPVGAPVPPIQKLEVKVTGAVGVHCARDDGTSLSEGGLPFGDTAEAGDGFSLMSPEWWRLGKKLRSVTVTPVWVGLPPKSFSAWYGPDEHQKAKDWLWVDKDLNITTDTNHGKPLNKLTEFPADTRAHRVSNGSDIAALIPVDPGYPGAPKTNGDFRVDASLMQQGRTLTALSTLSLFANDTAQMAKPLVLTLPADLQVPMANPKAPVPDIEEPARWPWYLRLTLTRSFLQHEYEVHERAVPQTLMLLSEEESVQYVPVMETVTAADGQSYRVHKMVETSQGSVKKTPMPAMEEKRAKIVTPVPLTVPKARWNPPYIPQWAGVQVAYEAADNQVTQRIITPFGHVSPAAMQIQPEPPAVAEVYVGIDGITTGQLLSLHWQVKSPARLPLEWDYLTAGDGWARLTVNDDTDGWHTSGIWSVDWPEDVSRTSTSLPTGRMWLRGRVTAWPEHEKASCALPTTPWLAGMVTNAALARLVSPHQVQAAHFETGLPAGRIVQALSAPETLQSVTQPWRSQGGRAAETQAEFQARVARRLRHRERGLNNVDLMMLLQDQHKGIRELAVLPASPNPATRALCQTLVVMPGPTLSDSDDECRPGLSCQHLAAMAEELKTITSPWLSLKCVNPEYVPVSISWNVEYVTGVSHAMGYVRVKAALDAALMAWSRPSDDRDQPVLGRSVTHRAVRDVLHRLPEVATIKDVYLNGQSSNEPMLTPGQVAVVTCVPREYTGLTLTWVDGSRDIELTSGQFATVQITLPTTAAGHDDTPAEVYLVNLDTGRRLPTTETGNGLWSEREPHKQTFKVHTPVGLCGIFRLGIVVVYPRSITLQSASIGESLTLFLRQYPAAPAS
ncbi:TPA: hypothetical protein SMF39_004404 [Serratia marcescens]|nr:hypothetical protein [Serratia marcescens]